MAENKKLTYVDGSLWFNGQLVATVSDEWIRANIQTIKNILEVSSGGPAVASDVSYDNTISQIIATNVQAAIDEIHEEIDDRAGACEGRLDVVEDNIDGLVDTINMEVIPEELGATVGEAIVSVNDSLNGKVDVIIRSGESVSFDTKTPAYGSGIVFAVIGGYGSVVFAYSLNGTTVSIVDLSPITATGKITPSSNGTTITFSTTGRNTNYKIIDF